MLHIPFNSSFEFKVHFPDDRDATMSLLVGFGPYGSFECLMTGYRSWVYRTHSSSLRKVFCSNRVRLFKGGGRELLHVQVPSDGFEKTVLNWKGVTYCQSKTGTIFELQPLLKWPVCIHRDATIRAQTNGTPRKIHRTVRQPQTEHCPFSNCNALNGFTRRESTQNSESRNMFHCRRFQKANGYSALSASHTVSTSRQRQQNDDAQRRERVEADKWWKWMKHIYSL